MVPTSTLILMWIKTHRCLVRIKDPKLIESSSPGTHTNQDTKSRYNKNMDSTVHTTEYEGKRNPKVK